MSAMKEVYSQKCEDFDCLHETSMKWNADTWLDQVNDGRFMGKITFTHSYIYWFESYVSLMAGRNILEQLGEEYEILTDEASGQWCMTSTFESPVWAS